MKQEKDQIPFANSQNEKKGFFRNKIRELFNEYIADYSVRLSENEKKLHELNKQNDVLKQQNVKNMQEISELNEALNNLAIKNQTIYDELLTRLNRIEEKSKDYVSIEHNLNIVEENVRNNNARLEILDSIELNLTNLNNSFEKIRPLTEFSMLNKITNSQAGEDSILAYMFAVLGVPFDKCTYLDLGANHPREMSNTYFFYSQGARGVLVDANADICEELRKERPGDIVINKCVTDKSGETITFNILNVDGISTTENIEDLIKENPNVKLERAVEIESICYTDLVKKYLGKAPEILNLDIEGKEMDILNSIDFINFRPHVLIIEMIPYSTDLVVNVKNQKIMEFMKSKDYDEFAFTGINSIFIDKRRVSNKERK